jgi:hypothetical protein
MPELILERGSDLYSALADAARERRCVFVTGLPGVGKSLIVQQLALIAAGLGREVDLLQWDVARLAFDRPEILSRYPEVDGVTHAAIRAAVGLWARDAVGRWDRAHPDPRHLLIGETPLIGDRLSELARRMPDDVEPLLASERTLFLIPSPSRKVREHVERARSRDIASPRHERDTASAAPHLVRAGWEELARVAVRLGIVASAADGYDELVYIETYRAVLRRRHSAVLPIAATLAVGGSAHAVAPGARELIPSTDEVARSMATIAQRPVADVERGAHDWYET